MTSHKLEPIERILRLQHISLIKEIHQHPLRRPPIRRYAQVRLGPDTPRARCRIRRLIRGIIRDIDPQSVQIEEVVDDVHAAVRAGAGWTVETAIGEGGVCRVVGGFKKVGEFVQDVGVRGRGGAVVC